MRESVAARKSSSSDPWRVLNPCVRRWPSASTPVGNGGDDWSWLWVWRVEEPEGHDEPARRGRQLLLVEKPESASGYLWWDGSGYQWTQGAD